jgi:hypothetical protein
MDKAIKQEYLGLYYAIRRNLPYGQSLNIVNYIHVYNSKAIATTNSNNEPQL